MSPSSEDCLPQCLKHTRYLKIFLQGMMEWLSLYLDLGIRDSQRFCWSRHFSFMWFLWEMLVTYRAVTSGRTIYYCCQNGIFCIQILINLVCNTQSRWKAAEGLLLPSKLLIWISTFQHPPTGFIIEDPKAGISVPEHTCKEEEESSPCLKAITCPKGHVS